MSIDILPDEALLDIFSLCLVEESGHIAPWLPLVHVCQRWRSIVFASPRRLGIRVCYRPKRPVKELLDIWPNLPIHISALGYRASPLQSENSLLGALEHDDLICQIQLDGSYFELGRILPAMEKPFPALTSLAIICFNYDNQRYQQPMVVLSQAFLGGSSHDLRSCHFQAVEFPGIWELLLTANHLVTLILWDIPYSMYTSSEAMATCLSTMPNLESLSVVFLPPQSSPYNSPDQPNRLLSPLTRVILPSLTTFRLQATGEYIEDIVSWMDAPLLDEADIRFFDQLIFDTPRLHDFLGRIKQFKAHSRGNVMFVGSCVRFRLELGSLSFELTILCRGTGRQMSSMVQLCSSSPHLPYAMKRLDIWSPLVPRWYRQDEVEDSDPQWLELLRPFTRLKDLHLSGGIVQHYALALRDLTGERVTEVLPELQNLFIEGLEPPIQDAIGQFVAARQQSGLPVMVHSWDGLS